MWLHQISFCKWRPRFEHLNMLSTGLFLIALSMGLYLRLIVDQWDSTLLAVCIVFLVLLFFGTLAMSLYTQLRHLVQTLAYLWIGYLFGVVTIQSTKSTTSSPLALQHFPAIMEMADLFFYSCVAFKILHHLLQRLCNDYKPFQASLKRAEFFEMLGVSVSFFQFDVSSSFSLITFNISFALCLIALRGKSVWGFVNLCILTVFICTPQLLPHLLSHLHLCPSALIAYTLRLCAEPILDCFFSPLSVEERWWTILRLPACWRHGFIVLFGMLELVFCGFCAYFIPQHQEWLIVLPIFVVMAVVWACFHVILLVSCWQFMRRLSLCNRTYDSVVTQEQATRMSQIFAAKGVRHFALLAARFVVFALVSTLFMAFITWETRNVLTLALLTLVWPLELLLWSVFAELGATLGGTCLGYAIVAPTPFLRNEQSVTLLPIGHLNEQASRCTQLLNLLQLFFSEHMIDNFGCDYSSSGLDVASLTSKLRSFFQRVTIDGLKYDTYFLYYNGHTYSTGDWALSDNGVFKLSDLLDLWLECHSTDGTSNTLDNTVPRLVLLVDAAEGYAWIKALRKLAGNALFVALQTCRLSRFAMKDKEQLVHLRTGDFTHEWILSNSVIGSNAAQIANAIVQLAEGDCVNWSDKKRTLLAEYIVSRRWTDFVFRLPNAVDMAQHWRDNFPRCTLPLLRFVTLLYGRNAASSDGAGNALLDLLCVCGQLRRCLKRKRMAWLPPSQLDTGHGFRLVRSGHA